MKLILLIAVCAMSASTFAATKNNYCGTKEIKDSNCKNIPGNRRTELGKKVSNGTPVAISLSQNKEKTLSMYYATGRGILKCSVTAKVEEFKLSSNPGDVAAAYFIKNGGDLYDLRVEGDVSKGCPKAKKVNMIKHAKESGSRITGTKLNKAKGKYRYRIVSNAGSRVVGMSLLDNGDVFYWSDKSYEKHDRQGKKGYNELWDMSN